MYGIQSQPQPATANVRPQPTTAQLSQQKQQQQQQSVNLSMIHWMAQAPLSRPTSGLAESATSQALTNGEQGNGRILMAVPQTSTLQSFQASTAGAFAHPSLPNAPSTAAGHGAGQGRSGQGMPGFQANARLLDLSKYKYQTEIAAMMYTFGEIRSPNPETCALMEDIIRAQMIELLIQASQLARRRSSRHFSHEDLIFLIRRDRMKVARLTAYLSWRKVRKIANRTGTSTQPDVEAEEFLEDGGATAQTERETKVRKQKIRLAWNLMDQFDAFLAASGIDSDEESADEDDHEYFRESRQRLLLADLITKAMTHDEYMDFADCRQSSFTYKKPSKFREWLQIERHTGMRPNNDLLDILGFMCYELVRTLTEQSLAVKQEMELSKLQMSSTHSDSDQSVSSSSIRNHPVLARQEQDIMAEYGKFSLFMSPNERTSIEPAHLYEAFRRLQRQEGSATSIFTTSDPVRNHGRTALRNFAGGPLRTYVTLI